MHLVMLPRQLSQYWLTMNRERKVPITATERQRRYKLANPDKILLSKLKRKLVIKNKRKLDPTFDEQIKKRERTRKQRHRLALKASALQQV